MNIKYTTGYKTVTTFMEQKNNPKTKNKSQNLGKLRYLLLLVSAWCMGIGLRFIMMNVGSEIYVNGWFDKIFDWGILFTLGLIVFIISIYDYLTERKPTK